MRVENALMSKHLLLRYVSRALGQRSSGDAYAIPNDDSDGHTNMALLLLLHKYWMIVRDTVALVHVAMRSRFEDARRWTIERRGSVS